MSIKLASQKILKDWIDYNGHMNVTYYLLIFDKFGADNLNTIFNMGEHSAKTTGMSTMMRRTDERHRLDLAAELGRVRRRLDVAESDKLPIVGRLCDRLPHSLRIS